MIDNDDAGNACAKAWKGIGDHITLPDGKDLTELLHGGEIDIAAWLKVVSRLCMKAAEAKCETEQAAMLAGTFADEQVDFDNTGEESSRDVLIVELDPANFADGKEGAVKHISTRPLPTPTSVWVCTKNVFAFYVLNEPIQDADEFTKIQREFAFACGATFDTQANDKARFNVSAKVNEYSLYYSLDDLLLWMKENKKPCKITKQQSTSA